MDLSYRFTRRAAVFAAAFALALPGALPGVQVAFAEEDDDQIIEEVVVTGIRGSLRQSLDMKRDADNIMDALVAEDIGKFPDQNLAESLQRISGVAIDRMRGEGAQVSIRGLGPQFTRVLVNGRGALSGGTQAFAGNIGDHSQHGPSGSSPCRPNSCRRSRCTSRCAGPTCSRAGWAAPSTSAPGGRSTTADGGSWRATCS